MTIRSTITKSALGAVTASCLLLGTSACGGSDGGSAASGDQPSSAPTSSPPTTSPPTTSPSEQEPSADSSETKAEPVTITIKDFEYHGPDSVAPGAEITVENEDSSAHTLTADDDGDFDVTIQPGKSKTFTAPQDTGSYPYHCNFHANMSGTLVVT